MVENSASELLAHHGAPTRGTGRGGAEPSHPPAKDTRDALLVGVEAADLYPLAAALHSEEHDKD